jgi:hypothetical protein
MGQGVTGACKTRGLPGSRGVCSSVKLRLRIRLHACGPRTTVSKRCLSVPSRDICDWAGAKRLDCCLKHDGQLVGHSPEFAVVSETSTIDLKVSSIIREARERAAGRNLNAELLSHSPTIRMSIKPKVRESRVRDCARALGQLDFGLEQSPCPTTLDAIGAARLHFGRCSMRREPRARDSHALGES